MIRPRHAIETSALGAVLGLSRLLPRGLLLGAGDLAGRLGYLLDGRHRRVAIENLLAALGAEQDERSARRVARDAWRHFGRVTLDTLTFPRWSAADVARRVRLEGADLFRAAWQRGRGVLLVSAHYGHWELGAYAHGHLGFPMILVTRPLDNPALERMLARLRERSGNRVVHKRNALREMVRACQEGIGIGILIDQDARGEGVFVPFFGRPASTTPAVALLALRTGAAVIPCRVEPESRGRYCMAYGPEIPVEATGDRQADVARITAACTAVVEGWIRGRPELWLWMHRRWKTQPPPGIPSGAGRTEDER